MAHADRPVARVMPVSRLSGREAWLGRGILVALLATVAYLAPALDAWAGWSQPGSSPVSGPGQTGTKGAAIAGVGGRPYVAWGEKDGSHWHVFVARLGGSGWQPVGGALNRLTTDNAIRPTITDLGGEPYVAFEEYGDSQWHIYVSRFDGSSWQPVGDDLHPSGPARAIQPRIGVVAGALYVAWEESSATASLVNVDRFDGSSWQPVGEPLNRFPSDSAYWAVIADVNGVPYVAWEETYQGASHVLVDSFDGTSWQPVGDEVREPATVNAYQPSIAVVGGIPYVAWEEEATPTSPWHSFVAVYDGQGWQPLGGELRSTHAVNALGPNIAAVGSRPYVVWEEFGRSVWHIWAARLVSSDWQIVGGELNTAARVHSIRPAIAGVAGFPFGTWGEYAGNRVTIHAGRLEPDYYMGAKAGQRDVTLRAVVGAYGLPYRVGFMNGRSKGTPFATGVTPTAGEFSPLTARIQNLSPGTQYSYRPFAVMGPDEPLALGPVQRFSTLTPPTPRIAILTRTTQLDARGSVKVRVRCPPGGLRCRGPLELTLRVRVRVHKRGRHRRPTTRVRSLLLGKLSFRVEAGRRSSLSVHLSTSARRRVNAQRRLAVLARATVRGGSDDTHTKRKITIRARGH